MLGGDVIPNKAVGTAMIECICICIRQLGSGRWLSFYHSEARDTINNWQAKVGIERTSIIVDGEVTGEMTRSHLSSPADLYDEVVGIWMSNVEEDGSRSEYSLEQSRASEVSLAGMVDRLRVKDAPNTPYIQSITGAATAQWSINIEKLHKSWDVSQKTSREDYDEWMRRFSIQLLQEAPSAALRACAELAASYPPLARELFSSAFVCCWVELNENSRANLVYSLQHVFASDASLEILQLLLNLCEFMEHDVDIKGATGGLPIKINVLAELAIKCRAYSKALHYKELEYIRERSGSCVEYLIDINKKLDLPEAALGVLKAAKIELERRGSPVFTHYRNNSRDTKSLSYSVLVTDGSTHVKEQSSWGGHVMYETWLTKLGSWYVLYQFVSFKGSALSDISPFVDIQGPKHCQYTSKNSLRIHLILIQS
jgi:FKBP12-rapamycin complex-associated protein